MAFSSIKNIGFFTSMDVFNIYLDGILYPSLRNLGPGIATGVELTVTMSTGLMFNPGASTVPRGTFNEGTGVWSLGSVLAGESLTPEFSFKIQDDCPGEEFVVTFTVSSNACDCNFENNEFEITIEGTSCCEINSCIDNNSTFTTYLAQGANLGYTLCSERNKIIFIEATADITVTLTGPTPECVTDSVVIKHIGTGANRVNKIRVVGASGNVDGDTYFEFDNVGSALNNSRGYNLSSFRFRYDGTNFWVFSE